MNKVYCDSLNDEAYVMKRLYDVLNGLPKEVSCLVVDDDVFDSLKRMIKFCEECHGQRDYIPFSGYRIIKRSRIVDVWSKPLEYLTESKEL